MDEALNRVMELLEAIVSGKQRGRETARELESSILEAVPEADDDERFEQLLHILASYEPEGGPLLFSEADFVEECRRVLTLLKT